MLQLNGSHEVVGSQSPEKGPPRFEGVRGMLSDCSARLFQTRR